MYDPPGYLWAITIAGSVGIPAVTCGVLYGGAVRAGLGRRRAALLAAGAAVLFGGWFTASAVIAGHGWYHTRLGHGVPWLPVAVVGYLGTLLALRRIPVVARALAAPGMVSRLMLPHSFRVAGVAFLLTMALGHLPAVFALPALALGTLTGFQLLNVTPSSAPISELPLALIPTTAVPLLLALHITSVLALRSAPRTPRPATSPIIADMPPRTAVVENPGSPAR
jgi:hypothetical protein